MELKDVNLECKTRLARMLVKKGRPSTYAVMAYPPDARKLRNGSMSGEVWIGFLRRAGEGTARSAAWSVFPVYEQSVATGMDLDVEGDPVGRVIGRAMASALLLSYVARRNEGKTYKLFIAGPNLRDQTKGTFHVHAAYCADIRRQLRSEPEYANGWTVEVKTQTEVCDDIYPPDDFECESGQYLYDIHFFPCCETIPVR